MSTEHRDNRGYNHGDDRRRSDRRDDHGGYAGRAYDDRGSDHGRRDDRRGQRDFDRGDSHDRRHADDRRGYDGRSGRGYGDRNDYQERSRSNDRRGYEERDGRGYGDRRRDDRGRMDDRRSYEERDGRDRDRRYDDEREYRGGGRDYGGRRDHGGRDYGGGGEGDVRDHAGRPGARGREDRRRDDRGYSDGNRKQRDSRSRRDDGRGFEGRDRRGGRGFSDRREHDFDRGERRGDRRDFRGRDRRDEDDYSYGYVDFEGDSWDDEDWDDEGDDFEAEQEDAPAARRVELYCPVSKRCGGCEWLAMPYDVQLEKKQEYIEDLFGDFKCEVEPIVGMDEPWGYRNKVQLPFAPGRPGRDGRATALWGIFERGSHLIVPCRACLVEDERARPIIATVAELLPRYNVKPYSEKTFDGMLRYCLVRTARTTGQVMLTLVCNGSRLPKAFVAKIAELHPEITTIVLNVNTERTSVILGKEEKVLMGPGYIEDELCGCRFRISSSSFYQTNPVAAESLYNLAIEMARLRPSDRIGDAYCGTGTIGIVAAKQSGAKLLGVERNGDAVEDARINAQLNGIDDAEFVTGDAGAVFARMARAGEQLDVVFMDPPRAGSSQAFLANLSRLAPRRVVYISCEPKSQHHDIIALLKNGYKVTRIQPVDMFPHTDHVENIVLLERKQHKRPQTNRAWNRGDQQANTTQRTFEPFDEPEPEDFDEFDEFDAETPGAFEAACAPEPCEPEAPEAPAVDEPAPEPSEPEVPAHTAGKQA